MSDSDKIRCWAEILATRNKSMMVAEGLLIRGGPHPYFPTCGEVAAGMPEGEDCARLWAGAHEMFRTLAAIRNVCRKAATATPTEQAALLPMIIAQVSQALPLPTIGELNDKAAGIQPPADPAPPAAYVDMAGWARSFGLRQRADMRAVGRWQAATGKVMEMPDHADLCVWLMERLDAQDLSAGARVKAPGPMICLDLGNEPDGWDLEGNSEPGHSLMWKAIQVWSACQNRIGVTIGEAAAVFNVPLAVVARAIIETDNPFMCIVGPPDDPNSRIEHEGE